MVISLEEIWKSFAYSLPNAASAILILIIGWVLGRLVGKTVSTLLKRSGVDRLLKKTVLGKSFNKLGIKPLRFFDLLIRWFIYLIALFAAIDILQIQTLSSFMKDVIEYLPHFIVGVAILIFGFIFVDFIGDTITTFGKESKLLFPSIVAIGLKVILYFVVLTVALTQMKVDVQILYIFANALAWGIAVGIAVGLGIAIGWGLKDVIAKNIDTWIPSIEKTEKYCRLILEKQEKEGKLNK